MKIRNILSMALVVSMLGNVSVMAGEISDSEQPNAQVTNLEQQIDSFKFHEKNLKS